MPVHKTAENLEPGDRIRSIVANGVGTEDFRAVADVSVAERNEWLTGYVTFADGGNTRVYSYGQSVEVAV